MSDEEKTVSIDTDIPLPPPRRGRPRKAKSEAAPAPNDHHVSKWRELYNVHPAADVFPMMSEEELDALTKDIEANDLKERMTFWRGWLIDGRNRMEALSRAGIPVLAEHKTTLPYEANPVPYIISKNIHRRHLHLSKAEIADLIVAAHKAGDVSVQVDPKLSKRGRPEGRKANPTKAAIMADTKRAGISDSTAKRAMAKAEGKKPKTKRKTKRQTEREEAFQALLQEREREGQLMGQQWVAEGHSLKDSDKAAILHWEHAWHDAHTREEREAWLVDHPGDDPLPWYECQMTDAQSEKFHPWREQREPRRERILELKSEEHLSLLKAAWGAADKDARDKFRLYITEADQEPEAA